MSWRCRSGKIASKAKDLTKKKVLVNEIRNAFETCHTVVVIGFNKIDANKLNTLRGDLESAGAYLKIYKNTLVALATKEKFPSISKGLVFKNAFVFSKEIGMDALRVLKKFSNENKEFTILKGIFDFREIVGSELNVLASLPDKKGLLSMLLSALNNKIKILLYGLKEVAIKKGDN